MGGAQTRGADDVRPTNRPARLVMRVWMRRALLTVVLVLMAAWWWYGLVLITGGSMEPSLSRGDVVIYRRAPSARANRGDMVVFACRSWPRSAVHRVRAVSGDGTLTTRGDANPIDDFTPVKPSAVRGVVIARIPVGESASRVARRLGEVVHCGTNRRAQR